MATLPPPGTFRLYPYAEPPLPAGRYTLTGSVTGLPGDVEPMPVTVDVVAPRFAMPPEQVLGTFPPAGARGSFTSRLPQIVLRRRTLPWERSPDLSASGTPTPWLALVLVAEGEGALKHDQPVERCTTDGVSLAGERDVPTGTCLEVPQSVVDKTFPTREDLAVLTHVREVDLLDTELAMGDDDGWMAVVLANRLPQASTRYLACVVNLEQQWDVLPEVADVELELDYDRFVTVMDLATLAQRAVGTSATTDVTVMNLPGAGGATTSGGTASGPQGASEAAGPSAASTSLGPVARAAVGGAVPTGTAWASGPASAGGVQATSEAAAAAVNASVASTGSASGGLIASKLALADGFSYAAALALEPVRRFPVLAYWSFQCEERGDFQYLAERVTSRLLGYLPADPDVPETPDGDPVPDGGAPPAGAVPEPSGGRPLPLVAETGHVALQATTRGGDAVQAWYRGPLVPAAVERATQRPDGDPRPPLAHHADQLRRVTPDGREDLGYSAAFEIGRLLALSMPGVAGALTRWRQEAFGAARVSGITEDGTQDLPDDVREGTRSPDRLTDDTAEHLRPRGAGRRAVRALLDAVGNDPTVVAPPRPLAEPADADELRRLLREDRDAVVARGLALAEVLEEVDVKDQDALASALASTPAVIARERDPDADVGALRDALEQRAALLSAVDDHVRGFGSEGFHPGGGR